jgi:hypothetical protein
VLFVYLCILALIGYLTVPPFVSTVKQRIAHREREEACARQWLESALAIPTTVPVSQTRWNSHGDRLSFVLPDDTVVRLACFWPRPVAVACLRHASFRDDIGWVIDAVVENGDPVRFYAWSVRLTAAQPDQH